MGRRSELLGWQPEESFRFEAIPEDRKLPSPSFLPLSIILLLWPFLTIIGNTDTGNGHAFPHAQTLQVRFRFLQSNRLSLDTWHTNTTSTAKGYPLSQSDLHRHRLRRHPLRHNPFHCVELRLPNASRAYSVAHILLHTYQHPTAEHRYVLHEATQC